MGAVFPIVNSSLSLRGLYVSAAGLLMMLMNSGGVTVPTPTYQWLGDNFTVNVSNRVLAWPAKNSGPTLDAIGTAYPQRNTWAGGGSYYSAERFDGTNEIKYDDAGLGTSFGGVAGFSLVMRVRTAANGSVAFRVFDNGDTNGFTFTVGSSTTGSVTLSRTDEAGTGTTTTTWSSAVPAAGTSTTFGLSYLGVGTNVSLYVNGSLFDVARSNTRNIGTDLDRMQIQFAGTNTSNQIGALEVWTNTLLTQAQHSSRHSALAALMP